MTKFEHLRVDPKLANVRHNAADLPDVNTDAPCDLFALLPPYVKRAFDLGITNREGNFHVFVEAATDIDVIDSVIARALELVNSDDSEPCDIAYVHDFDEPASPRPLRLPAGGATMLAQGLSDLVERVKQRLPALAVDDSVRAHRHELTKALKDRQKKTLSELEDLARSIGFGIKTVPGGIQSFPILHGKPVSPEQFEVLDESTKDALTAAEEKLADAIEAAAERVRTSTKDIEVQEKKLQQEAAKACVREAANDLFAMFESMPDVIEYLHDVVDELALSADDLVSEPPPMHYARDPHEPRTPAKGTKDPDPEVATDLARFVVNEFVTNTPESDEEPAEVPVIFEDNPTFANLFGFLERRVHQGSLVTDFTRIRAGSLHQASGGVLILRALDVVTDPVAWERLKRVLRNGAVHFDDPMGAFGLYANTMRPRPCPIDTRVILIGPEQIFSQLLESDPDFGALFRVKVEIPQDIPRTPEAIVAMDDYLVKLAFERGWNRPSKAARARALDFASRLTEQKRRLALYLQPIEETFAFASLIASERAPDAEITEADMEQAWQERRERTGGAERELREMVLEHEVLLATEGTRVGVVNGLSVLEVGDVQFGHPMRITAVVSVGTEGVIDVEREASLGGSFHTKGVAILRGYLGAVFGQERPVALRAQIAFEQSYGEVEGDSASSSELYAILSAISELPIDQAIAVTGSVNQLGEIQVIGGVTAKIEGFYDLCNERGLTGSQGVLIPKSSVPHLVLRDDVAAALQAGKFQLYAIANVSEGIEILTGVPAGVRDRLGRFPAQSVFGRVERRLIEIAERMRRAELGEDSEHVNGQE